MAPTQQKFLGVIMIILGIGLAGYVLVRAMYYAPDADVTPPAEISENNATSSVIAGVITGTPQQQRPSASEPSQPAAQPASTSKLPARITIPKIGVNASVQHVGVKSNGQMANPNNFTDVGWYKGGTVPGNVGSAVMAGHVDNALALDGVFVNLEKLVPGDEVVVTRKDGVKLTFRVDKLEYYHYLNAPNAKIFTSSDGEAHLNLITCAGTWLKSERSYDQRLVVYTTLVD